MRYIILILSSLMFFLTKSAVADCFNCNFDNKNLANFVFKDQNLSNASFEGAYLVNASMQNTTFEGAYLIHAELSKRQVLESKFCENKVVDAMRFSGLCKSFQNN